MAIRFDPRTGRFVDDERWRARQDAYSNDYAATQRGYVAAANPWASREAEQRAAYGANLRDQNTAYLSNAYADDKWRTSMDAAKNAYATSLDAVGGTKPVEVGTAPWGAEGRPAYGAPVDLSGPDGQSYENWLASLGGGRAKEDYLDEMKGQDAAQYGFNTATAGRFSSTGVPVTTPEDKANWVARAPNYEQEQLDWINGEATLGKRYPLSPTGAPLAPPPGGYAPYGSDEEAERNRRLGYLNNRERTASKYATVSSLLGPK